MRKITWSFLKLILLLLLLTCSVFLPSGPAARKCKAQTCCETCQEQLDTCVNNGTNWTLCLALYNRCATGCGGCE